MLSQVLLGGELKVKEVMQIAKVALLGMTRAGLEPRSPGESIQHQHLWTVLSRGWQALPAFGLVCSARPAFPSGALPGPSRGPPTPHHLTEVPAGAILMTSEARLLSPPPAPGLGCLQDKTFSEAVTGGKARGPPVDGKLGTRLAQTVRGDEGRVLLAQA